jgi:nucleotide-binding universal stress UspA family protein
MYRKIIVAFDESEQARAAFDHALEIAQCFKAELLVVAVIRPPEPAIQAELRAILDDATEHYTAKFRELATSAASRGVAMRTEIAVGHPAEHLVAIASRESADMVVMGRRVSGVTLAESLSLSYSVLRRV